MSCQYARSQVISQQVPLGQMLGKYVASDSDVTTVTSRLVACGSTSVLRSGMPVNELHGEKKHIVRIIYGGLQVRSTF